MPWRNLVAHLQAGFGADWQAQIAGTPLGALLDQKPVGLITQMIAQGVRAPLASSAGRLFDAVAGALGIAFDLQSFEGQAAMELEALADQSGRTKGYPAAVSGQGVISWAPLWQALIADIKAGVDRGTIAARFHAGLGDVLAQTAARVAADADTRRIVLSGGVMQNGILRQHLAQSLRQRGYRVLCHHDLPANDGGIAVGQALIAAHNSD
jgi:hydrogenase maturation protein HypF